MSEEKIKHIIREDEEKKIGGELPKRVILYSTDRDKRELRSLIAWGEASKVGMAHYVFGKGWRNPEEKLADDMAYQRKYAEVMGSLK